MVEVYFDDFKVTQTKSPVIESQDFYPFGLKFNSYSRENSLPNKIKLFQGQEHIDDLGLNWDSFKWRNHQPDIGRFFNVDPIAARYYHNSPYAFSENKVTAHIELEGLESFSIKNLNLNALTSDKVQQRVAAANQSGSSMIKIDGGVQAGGVGGGFKLGPVQANGSLRIGTATASTTAPGNTQVQGSLISLQGGVKAPETNISGNVNVGNASANITPQGKTTGDASLVNAGGKIELPGVGGGGMPSLPDNMTVSHTTGEPGARQTTSVSTNGEVGVSAVIGNVYGSISVNVISAFNFVSNVVGAVGAYIGATVDNMRNPVSSDDQRQVKTENERP
jgi:RHS repeat-associated protein